MLTCLAADVIIAFERDFIIAVTNLALALGPQGLRHVKLGAQLCI
jgi:hypothetical protein